MSRRGWALFWALGVIWGVPYLLIKIAVEEMSPAVLVCLRVALAAALLIPIAARKGWLRPALRRWPWVVAFAAIEIAVPFGLLTAAETRISSSLTGLLVATVPLFAAVLAWARGLDQRPGGVRLVGLLTGLAGVACLAGIDLTGDSVVAALAVVGAAFCYALGPIVATVYLADLSSIAVSGLAMAVTAVAYVPGAAMTWPAGGLGSLSWTALACVVVLGLLCSAVAFIVLFALIAEVGPARTTVITYVNPAVAVVLGVLVLDESVTAGLLLGFPLVIAGSWLSTRRGSTVNAAAAPGESS